MCDRWAAPWRCLDPPLIIPGVNRWRDVPTIRARNLPHPVWVHDFLAVEEAAMPVYKAPVDEVLFLLNEVFHIERYANLPGFADASPDVVAAILGEAGKFCEDVLTPLNRTGDTQGCRRHDDGSVTTP